MEKQKYIEQIRSLILKSKPTSGATEAERESAKAFAFKLMKKHSITKEEVINQPKSESKSGYSYEDKWKANSRYGYYTSNPRSKYDDYYYKMYTQHGANSYGQTMYWEYKLPFGILKSAKWADIRRFIELSPNMEYRPDGHIIISKVKRELYKNLNSLLNFINYEAERMSKQYASEKAEEHLRKKQREKAEEKKRKAEAAEKRHQEAIKAEIERKKAERKKIFRQRFVKGFKYGLAFVIGFCVYAGINTFMQ